MAKVRITGSKREAARPLASMRETLEVQGGNYRPIDDTGGGSAALRGRLRLAPNAATLVVKARDLALVLQELDAFKVQATGRGARVEGLAADFGRMPPKEDCKPISLRLRKDVVELVEKYATERGAREPWSVNRTVNALLLAALGGGK